MDFIRTLHKNELWADFFIGSGLVGVFALLGYFSHQFALLQANIFTSWTF